MASSFDRLKELNLSRDEVNRIGEALKKEEFRKLLCDYVDELRDPKNREIYENEVKEVERERGQDVTFLHPTPGYVIKTSVNGNQKAFINICSNVNISKPSSSPTVKDGAKGLQWSLPHSLSPPRDDVDNKGIRCQVYDILFHPDTLHLANRNKEFQSMVNTIALQAIENNFHVNLDEKNLKFPKMVFKGPKTACIIRKQSSQEPSEKTPEEQAMFNKMFEEIDSKRPQYKRTRSTRPNKEPTSYTTPKYIIKHRTQVEIQDFTESKDSKLHATVPKELILEIDLPLLKSSTDIQLNVTEKTVQLISEKPAKYKLDLTLPYQVNEATGSAKFDKDVKKLVITLPVRRKLASELHRDDSGVESCVDSDLNSPNSLESDEESEEGEQKEPESKTDTDDFLDSSDLYNLPEFSCNIFDNIVAFTFNVKNVDESTVCTKTECERSLIKVKFTSVSSSFYSNSYAFYIKLSHHKVIKEEVNVETWDNNVILQIPLETSTKPLTSYFYGSNEQEMVEKLIEDPSVISKAFEDSAKPIDENKLELIEEKVQKPKKSPAIDIVATSYESSGDELSASSFSPRKSKGILKRMPQYRAKFGRSVSESSLDDFLCSSLDNYHHGSIDCVPEDSKEEDEEKDEGLHFKKTVRFNDVVAKQLFRSNSSILGQKKKNQRKAKNKKRAHERRYSESETSDVESKRERDDQTTRINDEKNENTVFDETGSKKDDTDIFHLEMSN